MNAGNNNPPDHSSPPTAKTITFIRHGVALHNICDENGAKPNLHDPKFTDSPLTRRGELQAQQLGERLRRKGLVHHYREDTVGGGGIGEDSTAGGRLSSDAVALDGDGMDVDEACNNNNNNNTEDSSTIELVICSPLTRCLQTASLIFPSYFVSSRPSSDTYTYTTEDARIGTYVLGRYCCVFCHADVREAHGKNYSDKRSPLSQLKSMFPTVQFHPSITENDTDWQPHTRETWKDVSQRVHNFFIWLLQQPHNNIAVVTHGVWMECALLNYCPEVLQCGKRVHNCDVYSGKLGLSSDGKSIVLTNVEQITFDDQ